MPSHLHLRYSGKIKQLKWPMDSVSAIQAIGKLFGIKPESILGFKDKDGNSYSIKDLTNDPEEAAKQSFMLITRGDEKKASTSPSPNKDVKSQSSPIEVSSPVQQQKLELMLISDYSEFERICLGQTNLIVLFVVNKPQQTEELASSISSIIAQFSQKFEFYCYIHKGAFDELTVTSNAYPLVIIYSGSNKLIEVPLNQNMKNLISLLERVQPGKNQDYGDEFKSYPVSFPSDDKPNPALRHLDDLFDQNEITGLEYYYLKSSLLEEKSEVTSIFSNYAKTKNSDQFKFDVKDLTSRELRSLTQSAVSAVKSPTQATNQNAGRPLTSEGHAKSRNKEISSVQERLIQMTAEIERKGLLNEHSASLIKSLILEENADVFRVMNSYETDMYDDQELSFKLSRLAEKLSPSIIRPTSPLPRKDELVKLVNNLVRKRVKDESHILLLNRLIMEGDELLYSTFDVFESDRDEEDLLDTLIRIIHRYRKKAKFTYGPFYESQKNPFAEELLKDRKAATPSATQERPPSQGSSYFLENRAKTRKGAREHNIEKDVFPKKDTFSPLHAQEQNIDINDALKSSPAVKSLPIDECGMVLWLARNKSQIVKDVISDYGGYNAIEKAVPSLSLIANKELNTNLKNRLDEKQKAYINDNKKVKNSAAYAAFQCFKYDHDLEGLLGSLQEIVKHMPKVENKPRKSEFYKDYALNAQNADDQAAKEKNTGHDSVTSIKVETPSQPVKTGSSTNNILDTGRPGSKYTPLLNRDQRADSFKGMFQLKLVSSDNPAAAKEQPVKAAQTRQDVVETEGTKNSLDAHLNVIIPPKSDINPFTQTFIDKFYESQGGFSENLVKFKKTLSNFKWITAEDISKLEYLYENFYYELFEVVYNYEMNKDLKELERRLREDILTVDLDNISLASASPRERKRMTTYHSFKALLQTLSNEKLISDKQYKTYLYLYTEEDVTVLAAYEVYQYTYDKLDFIDTLLLIEKVQFFKNESKYFEEISNFSDYMEYQLKIIFSLKRYLTPETRATLEKIIRSGDVTVMQIYQDYKRSRDCKNKNNLIHKLVNFAEENVEVVKNYEKSIVQNKLNSEQKNVKRTDMIYNFECNKMMPEVKNFDLIYDAINNDDELIHSIFEIYDFTKDKIDFIENTKLVYKFIYKRNVIDIVKKNKSKLGLTDAKIDMIEDLAKKNDKALTGIIEVYYANQDQKDLFENILLLVQTKLKLKANILNFIKNNKNKLNLTDYKIDFIEELAKKNDKGLMAIIEVYYAEEDEKDFFENISLLVKLRMKTRGVN